jgi:hypothetical protein
MAPTSDGSHKLTYRDALGKKIPHLTLNLEDDVWGLSAGNARQLSVDCNSESPLFGTIEAEGFSSMDGQSLTATYRTDGTIVWVWRKSAVSAVIDTSGKWTYFKGLIDGPLHNLPIMSDEDLAQFIRDAAFTNFKD